MILVPVKNLVDAKQRLSSILTPEERFALAQAMCEDVLQALASWQSRPSVAVVTSDSFARDLAARFNFEAVSYTHLGSHYADLLDGGINDWGGVSPLTPDFINPEKPWPRLEELRQRTEAKGFELRQRLPVYPEFAERAAAPSDLLAERLSAAADAEGYARRAV